MTPFESDKASEIALRHALANGDVDAEDILFYQALERLTAATFPSDRALRSTSSSVASAWESSGSTIEALDSAARMEMYSKCRQLVRDEALAGNILRKYMVHVCGNGPKIQLRASKTEDGEIVAHPRQEIFEELFPNGQDTMLSRTLCSQTFVNGSIFVFHLPIESPFRVRLSDEETAGYPQVRAVWPDVIKDIHLRDAWSLTPIVESYEVSGKGRLRAFRKMFQEGCVPSDNVTHMRINHEDNDGVWGISLFYRFTKEIMRYIDWLEQRSLAARAANLMYLFWFRKGATSGKKYSLPDEPMMIEMHQGLEDVKPVNLGQGAGSREAAGGDGYEMRMRLAQSVNLPEHEVSENAQYAAQIGKFGFPAKLFEYYQTVFTPQLQRVFSKAVGCHPQDVIVVWPKVDTRDRAQVVNELSSLERERIISKKQVRRDLGYGEDNITELAEELQQQMGSPTTAPGLGGFAGLGAPSSLGGISSPGASPLGLGSPGGSAPSIPGLSMSIPSGLTLKSALDPESFPAKIIQMQAQSDFGISYEAVKEDAPPQLQNGAIGADYGYASEGAAEIGGFDENGDIWIVGEMTFKRVPSDKWSDAFKYAMDKYPSIDTVYTGSDEPELSDALKRNGLDTYAKHMGEDRTKILLNAFLTDHKIYIHAGCEELLADLFPQAAEAIAGMDTTKTRVDHKDAFRYLVIGLLEKSGKIANIGSPEGQEITEAPGGVEGA